MAMTFEQWQQGNGVATRFFSLGRHALVEAFRLGGISAGDKVLLPDFICRDVLASLGAVGAIAVWYPIDATLRPLTNEKEWPDAKVVVAVNYFGFPQPLDCFRSYVARTHALLIEDNAHGFLSRDEEARWLGTRTPLGIFSLRKTLPFADGAMLACSDKSLASQMLPQIKEAGRGFSPNVALKGRLRQIPFVGRRVAGILTDTIRTARGYDQSDVGEGAADERVIPYPPSPHQGMNRVLGKIDIDAEIARRRDAYLEAELAAKNAGIPPVITMLQPGVSPYGFAFRSIQLDHVGRMKSWAQQRGFDLISWPALPSELVEQAPTFQRNLHVINFL